ncbi:nucleoside triphosphate pyrophosphohydrolase [Halomonas sp. MCCC 1A17488]|uniref:nucleoside triphosphate pyrophosphohydrolase n=1 Tax=unclassified Halomonas TaxID=2609666 RepID=UPI0018D22B56|nr:MULTISPECIES: nucleoside triphosphate pyrophosphohydrolase [unclassified Halomonas]MCE8015613.1 nucleoside triphosphate pyrophosphohydrolase [Halomonas sp. MCCC 1A17488]MCG3238946.1 nucleoside triphosphate pyrophosphohydrolase [Halomonas sp. MCCC 1A17488]QPP51101.1 nucleoside triphosphate pyrophosphohydrolase [Halomonas sp. SS10-MC5]
MSERRHDIDELLTLMAVLRDPGQGCPWDLEQDWDSIVPHTLEEAYEVADAIERRAWEELPGELGDLLFQVVYYSQFAREEGRFDFHDVVHTLTDKMVRRHPHVFPDGTLASRRPPGVSAEQVETQLVNSRWESLKADERAARGEEETPASVLDDVPRLLPALSRAAKLSKRAARVGFDWPDAAGVIAKIREELDEVEQALAEGDHRHAAREVGDLLFAVTNLARTLKADPEQCLRETNAKFERRFRHVESALAERGVTTRDVDLATMEAHWQEAKQLERTASAPSAGHFESTSGGDRP